MCVVYVALNSYGRQTADGNIIFGGDRVRCASDDYQVDDEVSYQASFVHPLYANVANERQSNRIGVEELFCWRCIVTQYADCGGARL